jgi:hypothetical protein
LGQRAVRGPKRRAEFVEERAFEQFAVRGMMPEEE